MKDNVFLEKDPVPTDELIQEVLGDSFQQLQELRNFVAENVGVTKEEWKYYGQKYGYNLKTFLKRRNLFFIIIHEGCFSIGLIFGGKAETAIMESDVSEKSKKELSEARKYGEGKGLTFEVIDAEHMDDIKKLILLKVVN
ncbi:MAG TPA: hypothetical protein DEQ34_00420 [Balneolaceae bacterium]|nr:hypothetical protein [Balneolaceae bacterium]|tara:strand:+ start:156754 stop:157173 length:420 start_codon:yes stop_codon:yes gene_type:complete